ncbi:hypothetical protein CPHO_04120 [Corynebacterium phocae]|uniref:NlpC/P60 domain-containing protein n=1 Tax=Corynebacterium phocae TaxID=161895 RepID=A0A1L7D6C8_9CORY|nr:hypothetical protein CPHO_04120 [Corynebacterium phocae]
MLGFGACVCIASATVGIGMASAQDLLPRERIVTPGGNLEIDPNADIAALVEEVSAVAREVSAKSEEVKELELKLGEQERAVAEAELRAEAARRGLEQATQTVQQQQDDIDQLALARYRGRTRSVLGTTLSSENPQEAAERLGYMGALSRDAHRKLIGSAKVARDSRAARAKSEEAVAEAVAKREDLARRKFELEKHKADLELQRRAIEERVDSLNEQQRRAWEGQFGPDVELDPALLDTLAASGTGGQAALSALTRQGAPYGWGSTGPEQFDCSGLMVWAYAQQGVTIPRTSQAQIAGGRPVPTDELQPGDIIGYFPGVTHVGMYIGNGQVVHASTYGIPVQVVPLNSMPVAGAVRY